MQRILLFLSLISLIFVISCDDYMEDMLNESDLNDGLVAYWPVTESSGLTVKDESENGNDIILSNSIEAYFADGVYNQALLFGGTTRDGVIHNPTILDDKNSFSASMWIKITGSDPGNASNILTIFDKVFLYYNRSSSKLTFSIADSTYATYSIQAGISADNWFYLTVTYDGSIMNIFINGNKIASDKKDCIMAKPNTDLVFASRGYTESVSMEGSLDEIRLYNRALSRDEINALMDMGVD